MEEALTRQIVLDTETTGLEPEQGHRIIEIGCVELIERRLTGNNFHQYLQPDRLIDAGAIEVHGITNEMLADKPRFTEIAADFLAYIDGAELIIHNAPFDVGFLDAELARMQAAQRIADICGVLDTLVMARRKHPGQRNSLDALCGRYQVDNTQREKHGALLDAEILADVYLAMTGGQHKLMLDEGEQDETQPNTGGKRRPVQVDPAKLRVVRPSVEEAAAHQARLESINGASSGQCTWLKIDSGEPV